MTKRTSKADPFREREAAKYEKPIPSREFILAHLKQRGKPAFIEELLQELQIEEPEEEFALQRRIKAMLRDEQLERLKGGLFWPAGQRTLYKGRVQIERKGKISKAWVIPEDGQNGQENLPPRILLTSRDAERVYQGNRVVVSVLALAEKPDFDAYLVEILEQQRLVLTGRFVSEQGFNFVIPHGKEFTHDILIPKEKENGAKDGQIVVVELLTTTQALTEPMGQVVEVLGHEDMPGIEIKAATRSYGLPEDWKDAVLKETAALSDEVLEIQKRDRLDLRELPLVTIDGEDAKDFDDAVYCDPKPKGGWNLYVAIADVSFYVKPKTALDNEARLRGNSVYFPGKVIPMLPERLSNGLCSLKPNVDRLCIVCIMHINSEGSVTRYDFHEALMHSKARLTYTKVAALLDGSSAHLAEEYKGLLPHIQDLYKLYKVLRRERERRGAIEFETMETKIIFDTNGKISRIEPQQRNEAHKIIEECMLAANVATAKFLKKHKLPALYRIHEGPSLDKLLDLKKFLQELGLSLGGGKEPQPIDYAKLLASVQNREDANIIQSVLLRSLSQAVYSPDNLGHFGLAYAEYCHFTSPIRRYPDLLVHRQIRAILSGEWTEKEIKESKTKEFKEELLSLGDHSSMTERRADDATRDAVRWLKCVYIQKHLGETFDGIISGVTRFGFFVELKDIYIDGLVHVNNLEDDYYYFDQVHHRLIGERRGKIFKLAEPVKVKVAKVDIDQRRIDFELLAGGSQGKGAKKAKPEKGKRKTGDRNKKRRESKGKRNSSSAKKTPRTSGKKRKRT